MKPKILIIPARRHIIESYSEYLIRYLGNEFYFEMGYPPMKEYYENIREMVPTGATSPLEKNPNDFDLIYPHFSTHWFLEPPEDYARKIAIVTLEPGQYSRFPDTVAAIGVTSKPLEIEKPSAHVLRFGVDTELFKPFAQARMDDKIHVGFIGNIQTPRRYMKELFIDALRGVEGITLDIYPTTWLKQTRPDEIEGMGGNDVIENIVGGDMWITGLPNIYNRMDIFIRCDIDHGYQFSVMEAAACGVPVVTVDSGITKELCDVGGGICIDNGNSSWQPENLQRIAKEIREAVILLRDNKQKREDMGILGRSFVEKEYTWKKWIPAWRDFFLHGLVNARKS